ncbi:MAG: hypothetical protein U1D64_04655, partial [Bacteroidales bacterium]|nr:hypothetical protein [Bacteroidales bacterium]
AKEVQFEDQSWFFEYLFNITFHTSDYIEHFVKDDNENYHSNLLLLKNNMDFNVVDHRDFIENDMAQSTRASNSVAKIAKSVGVKKLSFLVNHYYIKPENLKL